jgi:hypothetical protein
MKNQIKENYTLFTKGDKVWLDEWNIKLNNDKKILQNTRSATSAQLSAQTPERVEELPHVPHFTPYPLR